MAANPNSVPFSSSSPKTTQINSTASATQTSSQTNVNPRDISQCLSNILPSNQAAVTGTLSAGLPIRMPGTSATFLENTTAMEVGPGPLRHPKPLTAVDLYSQLEKEQEAVVNRLTRELTILRAAQNASVVSSTSSTSASGLPDNSDYNCVLSGHSHPTPSYFRRHRSSSAASSRSLAAANSSSFMSCIAADRGFGRTGPPRHEAGHATSQASIGGNGMSRQNSASKVSIHGRNQSGASSPIAVPAHSGSYHSINGVDQWPSIYSSCPSRQAPSRDYSIRSPNTLVPGGEKDFHLNNRFEEVTLYRIELENVKKENDMLKRRIRELESLVNSKKPAANVGDPKSSKNETSSNSKTNSEQDMSKVGDESGGVRLADPSSTGASTAK